MKKILHICLANFYVDNYSYQENILPMEHKNLGYEVTIIASTETFLDNERLGYVDPSYYVNEHGIEVYRIPYSWYLPKILMKKIRSYTGLTEKLKILSPDIIFVHDVQFLDAFKIKKYVSKNPNVKVYVDCHADFGNSARNFLSREVLHKVFYKSCAHALNKVATKFWGVLPSRVNFLKEVYDLPEEKVDLLLMGAEEKYLFLKEEYNLLDKVKRKYNINENKKLIVTGGKVNYSKCEILVLLEAVKIFEDDIELIIFGSISDDIRGKFDQILLSSSNVRHVGWLNVEDTYNILAIADLAIFPGGHSVLWEQCVAIGVPLTIRRNNLYSHLEIDNNIAWLNECSAKDIKRIIEHCLNYNNLEMLKMGAWNERRLKFSYSKIAAKSIEHNL
jgi:1,2-diacylglycerol 3-alpha-glucosyltransferase